MRLAFLTSLSLLLFSCAEEPIPEQTIIHQVVLKDEPLPNKPEIVEDRVDSILPDQEMRTFLYFEENNEEDGELKINPTTLTSLTPFEKAAIAYAGNFKGSNCEWDEENGYELDHMKCLITSSLGLGFQCEDTLHTFLKQWFREDHYALQQLTDCYSIPNTSSHQSTIHELRVMSTGNSVKIWMFATSLDMPEGESREWTETLEFVGKGDQIRMIKQERSKIKLFTWGIEDIEQQSD